MLMSFLRCSSFTQNIITAKDHASVQINVAQVDNNGTSLFTLIQHFARSCRSTDKIWERLQYERMKDKRENIGSAF